MDEKVLDDRRRALEEEFFKGESDRLREALKAKQEREEIRGEIQAVTGIHDPVTLDALVDVGIRADTVAALSLVPLVEVAWADGKLEPREKEALLHAAKDKGIDPRHPSYEMFSGWLSRRPHPAMLETWTEYIKALSDALDHDRVDSFRDRLLERARGVAAAAGGFLGMGNKISPEEEKMLAILERAFARD